LSFSNSENTLFLILFSFTDLGYGQDNPKEEYPEIGLDEAINLALQQYPQLQNAALEKERQKALKRTAYNFGNSQVFTGGRKSMVMLVYIPL